MKKLNIKGNVLYTEKNNNKKYENKDINSILQDIGSSASSDESKLIFDDNMVYKQFSNNDLCALFEERLLYKNRTIKLEMQLSHLNNQINKVH